MNQEDARVPAAVGRAIPQITRAVRLMASALQSGHRLFFLGAGTSGRLGVIEAAECPPTFNTPPALVQAIMAGGRRAVFRSREGAEDDRARGRREVARRVRAGDVVIGIAASGVTPFVEGGLRAARTKRAKTVLVTCSPQSRFRSLVDAPIAIATGPELLTGSTRLKAGTATKLALNMLTLGAMVQCGKVCGNFMIDVRPTSRKLRARAVRIIRQFTHVSAREAARLLGAARNQVKPAIVMAARGADYRQARRLLTQSRGQLRPLLD